MIGILTNKEAFKPVINTAEVEAVFDAPLEMFLKVGYSDPPKLSQSTLLS